MNLQTIRYLIMQSFREWREDNASRLAAALSYYTIFSFPPLLIISLAIVGRFYDRKVAQEQLIEQAKSLVGETGGEAVGLILDSASSPTASGVAAIISIGVLILGATGVFNQLQNAMDTIWEVQPASGGGIVTLLKTRFFSFTMVLAVGFLLLVSLILSTVLSGIAEFLTGFAPDAILFGRILTFLISLGGTSALFALIFKIVPHAIIRWRDVWPGAIVTGILFSIGKYVIGLYLGQSAPGSAYGAAGSLIVLLVWVYYSAQILFLGAEFTQVYANRLGAQIVPEDGAVSTVNDSSNLTPNYE